jgi:hypothetical protein
MLAMAWAEVDLPTFLLTFEAPAADHHQWAWTELHHHP